MRAPAAVSVRATPWAGGDAEAAFRCLAGRRGLFWLDSSLPRTGDGRFSVLGCEPRFVFAAQGAEWWLERGGAVVERGSEPLRKLDALIAAHRVALAEALAGGEAELPFRGGAVGWFSYDLGRQFERVEGRAEDDLAVPDIRLAWHDAAIVWDHREARAWLVGVGWERAPEAAMAELAEWLESPQVGRARPPGGPQEHSHAEAARPEVGPYHEPLTCVSDLTRAEYMQRVGEARAAIARGEIYQVNLVQRFACEQREPAAEIYLRLRRLNPAPFAVYQDCGDMAVLSSSPERFIEVEPAGRIRTCPIKGTRPRGATPAEDRARAEELCTSAKERAELLMIVDLLRNDLGRVCATGSVRVERLHALESFATVHHLVGEVTGQLRPDVTPAGLLRAVFPGGSITGAPKVSALQLIERLEPHRRGVFMGAMGYLSAHGRIDLNIAIRTLVCRAGRAYFGVGAGIVWDSDPAAEYAETLAKGRALFAALGAEPPAEGRA